MSRLVLVLGDQLSHDLSALEAADKGTDIVVMAEVMDEGSYVPHHPKKIALVLSAMRHFAEELRGEGWQVAYTKMDDPRATRSIKPLPPRGMMMSTYSGMPSRAPTAARSGVSITDTTPVGRPAGTPARPTSSWRSAPR